MTPEQLRDQREFHTGIDLQNMSYSQKCDLYDDFMLMCDEVERLQKGIEERAKLNDGIIQEQVRNLVLKQQEIERLQRKNERYRKALEEIETELRALHSDVDRSLIKKEELLSKIEYVGLTIASQVLKGASE